MLVFLIVANGFLAGWIARVLAGSKPLAAPLGLAAIAFGATYVAVARVLNRTTVIADGERLQIRHGPVPWFGEAAVGAGDVSGIRWTRRPVIYRLSTYRPPATSHFELSAVVPDGPLIVARFDTDDERRVAEVATALRTALGVES